MTTERIGHEAFRRRLTTAEEAATQVCHGDTIATSGFGAGGTPKALPRAIAARAAEFHARGEPFAVRLFTGASTSPAVDGALAQADAVSFRLPYMSDAAMRPRINDGHIGYVDTHLSRVAPWARAGFFGKVDTAIVEAACVRPDGGIVPTFAIGNAQTWLDMAERVIVEVNSWHTEELEGLHDIRTCATAEGTRALGGLCDPADRIGDTVLRVDPAKIVAVVPNHEGEQSISFRDDMDARLIAGHIIAFLRHEVAQGRLPPTLPPLQSGVGNIANAVMGGLAEGPFENMTAYTEVIQDGMLDMLRSGKMRAVSGAALYLSESRANIANLEMASLRKKIVIRPQEISNNPSVMRALGGIAMNSAIELDIYGNVNSTRVMGTHVQNGLGGSGDFARSALLSIFMTPSTARRGTISSIVPMVSHVDHINQDVQVVVTEQGLADLRGLPARERAKVIIENCAHPDFRDELRTYLRDAITQRGGDTPHILAQALGWHQRFMDTGSMRGMELS